MKVPLRFDNEKEHRERLAQAVNQIDEGKTSNSGSFTVSQSTTTTTVSDPRAGIDTKVFFSPTTASAATEIATMYHSGSGKGEFTVTHSNSAVADRTFNYVIVG
jgi:hypothetical protein